MTDQTHPPTSPFQRIVAAIVAVLVMVSLGCVAAILIGSAIGGMPQQGSGQGLWPTIFLFPLIALPVGFLLIIALILVTGRQRSRTARAGTAPKARPEPKAGR